MIDSIGRKGETGKQTAAKKGEQMDSEDGNKQNINKKGYHRGDSTSNDNAYPSDDLIDSSYNDSHQGSQTGTGKSKKKKNKNKKDGATNS